MTELIGKTLGQYEIKELIGKGGMALVYRATQTSMKRDVAIKVMNTELGDDPEFVQRFEREADLFAVLQHPHILPVIDFGKEDNNVYIAMRLVEGGSLDQVIKKKALTVLLAAKMLEQVGSALTFAHSKGIIHRDLKPNNVLLDSNNNAYLTDFGIAKMLQGTSKLTSTNTVLGTPAYMAPEQWRGESVDASTDIYSLGVMAFEMVTGRLPFEAETTYTLMYKHFNDMPPSPREFDNSLPEAIEKVILKSIEKDQPDRFQSAEEFANMFRAAAEGRSIDISVVSKPALKPEEDEHPTFVGGASEAVTDASFKPDTASMEGRTIQQTPLPTPMPQVAVPTASQPSITITSGGIDIGGQRKIPMWLVGLLAVVIIGGGAFFALSGSGEDEPTPPTSTPTATDTNTPTATNSPEPTITHTPTPGIAQARVLSQRSSVREEPLSESPEINVLERDTEVQVVAITEDGDWYRILVGGELGWVRAETVTIFGNESVMEVVALPTATDTATPTATDTPTDTPTATATDTPTDTPTPTATDTYTPTATDTPTDTPTITPTPVVSDTPMPPTPRPSPTAIEVGSLPGPPPMTVGAGQRLEPRYASDIGLAVLVPPNWQEVVGLLSTTYSPPDLPQGDFAGYVIGRGDPEAVFTDINFADEWVDGDARGTMDAIVAYFEIPADVLDLQGYRFPGFTAEIHAPANNFYLDVFLWELGSNDWLILMSLPSANVEYTLYRTSLLDNVVANIFVDGTTIGRGAGAAPVASDGETIGTLPLSFNPVLRENFEAPTEWTAGEVQNTGLVMRGNSTAGIVTSNPTNSAANRDQLVGTTFQVTETTDAYEVGVILRAQGAGRYYFIALNNQSQLNTYLWSNGELEALGPPIEIQDLDLTQPTQLQIVLVGDFFDLYVNTEYQVTFQDNQILNPGQTQLAIQSLAENDQPLEVTWRNVGVTRLETLPPMLPRQDEAVLIGSINRQTVMRESLRPNSPVVFEITDDRMVWILGRAPIGAQIFVYANGGFGWIPVRNVDLSLDGNDFNVDDVPVLDNVDGMSGREVLAAIAEFAAPETVQTAAPTDGGGFEEQGAISNAQSSVSFTFDGQAQATVTISAVATSGDLDPLVQLLDSDGNVVAENDDHAADFILPNTFDAAIVNFDLPSDGTYTVIVTRYNAENGTSAGDFNLSVSFEGGVALTGGNNEVSVLSTDNYVGTITNDQFTVLYTFEATANNLVTITTIGTSGDLDTLIRLINPDGSPASENDDHDQGQISLPSPRDSAIVEYPLDQVGTYTIEVTRFNEANGTTTGDFEMMLQILQAPELAIDGILAYGESITHDITDSTVERIYAFEGAAGDVVTITVEATTGSLDTILKLNAPDGSLVAENDDHNVTEISLTNTRDSALVNLALTQSGTYTITVSRFNAATGSTTGTFNLALFAE